MRHKNTVKGIRHGKPRTAAEREKAMLLKKLNVGTTEAAKITRVPESTIRSWWKKELANMTEEEKAEMQRAQEAAVLRIKAEATDGVLEVTRLMAKKIRISSDSISEKEKINKKLRAAMRQGDAKAEKVLKKQLSTLEESSLADLSTMYATLAAEGMPQKEPQIASAGQTVNVSVKKEAEEFGG